MGPAGSRNAEKTARKKPDSILEVCCPSCLAIPHTPIPHPGGSIGRSLQGMPP